MIQLLIIVLFAAFHALTTPVSAFLANSAISKFQQLRSTTCTQLNVNLNNMSIEELQKLEIDELIQSITYMDEEITDPERRAIIDSKIAENGLTDFEVRLRLLGINGFTIAGFILATIVLTLNAVLGNGWLGERLGWIPEMETPYQGASIFKSENAEKIKELRNGEDIDTELFRQQLKDAQERFKIMEQQK